MTPTFKSRHARAFRGPPRSAAWTLCLFLILQIPPAYAGGGILRYGAELFAGVSRVGKNGMRWDTYLEKTRQLLEAGKDQEALALTRAYGDEKLSRTIQAFLTDRQRVPDFLANVEAGNLAAAERMSASFAESGNQRIAAQMAELLDLKWAQWSSRFDQLIEANSGVSLREGNHIAGDDVRILKSIHSAAAISTIRIVPANVKRFVADFKKGASDPQSALHLAARHSPELVRTWKATAPQRRIFIAAAGDDLDAINALTAALEADGYTVFFYRFCIQPSGALCPSTTTGAFFQSAGKALFLDSKAASSSRYIAAEVGTAQRLQSGQAQLILVTPVEILSVASVAPIGVMLVSAGVTNDDD